MLQVIGWVGLHIFIMESYIDALQKVGVAVVGQKFDAGRLDQTDTPLEIVQVLRGIPTVGDHMRQAVQQVLHVATPTRFTI